MVHFREYINDIREKFENSLDLYVNMALKGEVPDLFKNIDYRNLEIIFILVIKEQKKEWLGNVKDAMEMAVFNRFLLPVFFSRFP